MCELLSPAGDMECLKAAVLSGADAVYIGGADFSARNYAKNFDHDEMREAVDYCHIRGVKIYAALNTMILERELSPALSEAAFFESIGMDAVIVSDIGLAKLIKENLDIPVHASTQMCIHNAAGAEILKSGGYSRVVPARELSLSDIRAIAVCGIETEVFVHGALCSGISGLCLMSSCIGQRSGNRGRCAQPCRLPYNINGEEKYFLSTADLCAAEHIKDLIGAGVCSFKIEGRMKPAHYVAGVTGIYREVISAVKRGEDIDQSYIKRLENFYNRTFTAAYLIGKNNICAIDRPDNRKQQIKQAASTARLQEKKCRTLFGRIVLKEHERAVFSIFGEDMDEISCVGEKPLETSWKPIDAEMVRTSLSKTGGTPFEFGSIDVVIEGSPFISKAELNDLRRAAVASAESSIAGKYRKNAGSLKERSEYAGIDHELRYLYVETADTDIAAAAVKAGADRIYFAAEDYSLPHLKKAAEEMNGKNVYPYIKLVPFLREYDFGYVFENVFRLRDSFSGALCGNISQAVFAELFDNAVLDITSNIANSASAAQAGALGFSGITLSHELAGKDILSFRSPVSAEMAAYGHVPVMWIAHEVFSKKMTDRKGYKYELDEYKTPRRLYTVNNPVMLAVKELAGIRKSIDAVRLRINDMKEIGIVSAYRSAIDKKTDVLLDIAGTTQGHLKRGV